MKKLKRGILSVMFLCRNKGRILTCWHSVGWDFFDVWPQEIETYKKEERNISKGKRPQQELQNTPKNCWNEMLGFNQYINRIVSAMTFKYRSGSMVSYCKIGFWY